MRVKLLNGSEENINLKKYIIDKDGPCKSKFQKRIRDELIEKYPQDVMCEEVYIKGEKFYLDFLIVSRGIVIEVNGRQHNEHIKFFHKTIVAFNKQRASDQRKRDFCKLNGFKLVEIYDE